MAWWAFIFRGRLHILHLSTIFLLFFPHCFWLLALYFFYSDTLIYNGMEGGKVFHNSISALKKSPDMKAWVWVGCDSWLHQPAPGIAHSDRKLTPEKSSGIAFGERVKHCLSSGPHPSGWPKATWAPEMGRGFWWSEQRFHAFSTLPIDRRERDSEKNGINTYGRILGKNEIESTMPSLLWQKQVNPC